MSTVRPNVQKNEKKKEINSEAKKKKLTKVKVGGSRAQSSQAHGSTK
jgi:hypothetical protein